MVVDIIIILVLCFYSSIVYLEKIEFGFKRNWEFLYNSFRSEVILFGFLKGR